VVIPDFNPFLYTILVVYLLIMLTLPNYQIGTQIYESANSLVYRGLRKKDNQPVILKVLKEDYPTPAELTRYRQEYEITKSLDLDGVVKTYGIEKYQNTLVIVLEDFGGESLKTIFEKEKQISISDFLPLAIQIAEALGQIHAANIIHKDINPANVVWNKATNQLKIIDFSIASRLPRENPSLKNPEQLEGTLAYISPEQTGRMNRSLDYRTDLYSLGVTFYELLTGKVPFESDSAMELVHCHIAKTPVAVNEVNPEVPPIISDIVMKLMAKNVEDRYQSAFGVKADLEKCQENLTGLEDLSGLQFELAQNDFSGKLQIPQKLYGRENEINTLLQAFERVSEGTTEIMLIAGYSGVGKTALVHEVHKPMTEKHGYFAAGKFDQFQKNIPYSAITQAFNKFCRYLLMESAETLENWQTKLLDAVGNNGQIIIDVIPDLELVIGSQPAVAEVGPTEAQNRFQMFFLNFVKALSDKEHPFILFIDDLQWVDSASLDLLKSILLDDEIRQLLIIGAYRDNEVDSNHPFMMVVDELQKANAVINTIELANLQPEDVNHLLQESLKCFAQQTQSLTNLIYQKTQGNAFFTHQFLQTLYQEALLRFDFEQRQWQWDVEQITAQNITANVVELMTNKIDKLPTKTVAVLQLAACMGNQFDLSILAIIYERDQNETLSVLWDAIVEGLIQPLDETYKRLEVSENAQFKFLHDRVQQAAYALIDDEQKKAVHLKIGRLLLANATIEKSAKKLFERVDHLNMGRELITVLQEQMVLARLNLDAGEKARSATAYAAARQYLIAGLNCLTHQSWIEQYDLTLALHKTLAEVEYLNGHFEKSEALIHLILEQAKTALEKAEIYNVLIVQYTMIAMYEEAIRASRTALTSLGIDLPKEDLQIILNQEQETAKATWEHQEIASLITQPEVDVPEIKMAVKLLVNVAPAAYLSNPLLFTVIVVKIVNLSLKYGHVSDCPYGYSTYGMIIGPMLGDYQSGYEFGLLALKVSEKFNNLAQKSKVCQHIGGVIYPWVKHIKGTHSFLNEGYQLGLESGDLQFAGYCLLFEVLHFFYEGKPLTDSLAKIPQFVQFSQQTQNQWIADSIIGYQLAFLNLTGLTSGKFDFHHEELSETAYLEICHSHQSPQPICFYQILKTVLLYLYGETVEALNYAQEAEQRITCITSFIPVAEHNFYHSLILTALYPEASEKQPQYWKKLEANQKQMKIWADNCPDNFRHKYLLVEAEIARISGKPLEITLALYEQAIISAKENEFIQNEALSNELLAKFWLDRNNEKIAQIYLKEAHYGYQQWGAVAKVKDLEERYPKWLAQAENIPAMPFSSTTPTSTILASTQTRTSTSQWLDLESVMKAAQTLASEIVLSRLLEKMMRIVIENAGAERGFLILPFDNKWVIEAESAIDKKEVIVLDSLPVDEHLPEVIINYVARTQENVVLSDARWEGLYTENPYIKAHQTQSVLCFPIVYQQQLRAILYFENNLTTGAFTPQRLNVLKMLSSQIAISLENAQVMAHLDTKVKERTVQLNAKVEELTHTRQELVQSEKMASLGRLVAGFAHELNTPIGVAIGSASALQGEAKKINGLMAQEEVDVDELLSALDGIDKGFDLTLSNLERAANLVTSFKRTAVDQTSDEVRSFQVGEVINDTINTLHNRFKKTNIEISLDCPKSLKVKSLPGALEQILTNLLMNSLIHGFEEGQQAGSININVQLNRENLHLEYSDNGKGIASENLVKIFEPFFTTHRAHGGSGLGMYICYNIVTTQLQGTITCESTVGKGVVFKIDYPII